VAQPVAARRRDRVANECLVKWTSTKCDEWELQQLETLKTLCAYATRDGVPDIDLVDGNQLLKNMKELGLGVKTSIIEVEQNTIDKVCILNI